MKLKGMVWALVALLVAGPAGVWAAGPGSPGPAPEQIYPSEDPQRMSQFGPGYEQEGAQAGPQAEPEEPGAAEESQPAEVAAAGQPPAPGRDFVWVEPYRMPGGVLVPGFWRPRFMAGFIWVAGIWNATAGVYVPGFWRPKVAKRGYIWAPGYWFGGRWFPGMWRPAARKGFIWMPGHWARNGEWMLGHWRPSGPAPAGRVWAPGYYDHRGIWMPGRWRLNARPGMMWMPGRYDHRGTWMPGHWRRQGPGRPEPQRPGRGPGHRGPRR